MNYPMLGFLKCSDDEPYPKGMISKVQFEDKKTQPSKEAFRFETLNLKWDQIG